MAVRLSVWWNVVSTIILSFNEYGIDLTAPTQIGGTNNGRMVDLHVTPTEIEEGDRQALIVVSRCSIAHHIDRQLTHRGAARSVSAMSAMLAHEIKPLSGIKGAAQLLEGDASLMGLN